MLQAESFSYSIAPLLEKRDVDRLSVVSDASGVVKVEVRNEALESHYIDQLELLEVPHAPDELVLPAARSGIIAVRGTTQPASIRDRAGNDLHDVLAMADGRALWQVKPFLVFFPAAFLSITVLAVNLLGDGLRDALDPRMAKRL